MHHVHERAQGIPDHDRRKASMLAEGDGAGAGRAWLHAGARPGYGQVGSIAARAGSTPITGARDTRCAPDDRGHVVCPAAGAAHHHAPTPEPGAYKQGVGFVGFTGQAAGPAPAQHSQSHDPARQRQVQCHPQRGDGRAGWTAAARLHPRRPDSRAHPTAG